MKLKPSLKSLVKRGLLLNFLSLLSLILGCSSSTAPTFTIEQINSAVEDICRNEYKVETKARLTGKTLWIYLPLEDILSKADKPEKYLEKFQIDDIKYALKSDIMEFAYAIKPIPDQEKFQEYKFNKEAMEKANNVWKVIRRVLFSLERSRENEPQFCCLVIADIKNGLEIQELCYFLDLKKVSYDFISLSEYQHRSLQETIIGDEIIGDKEGRHLNYADITLRDFITAQIQHRIKLKFQKPEVEKNVDIDAEIMKIIGYTIKIYDFQDFTSVQLNNLLTQNKILLNRAALRARPTE